MLRFRKLHLAALAAVAALFIFPVRTSACTGISFVAKDGSCVTARSIEWSALRLDSKYVIIPRGHDFQSLTPTGTDGLKFTAEYGFTGIAVFSDEIIVEGLNEKGLSAGLFFFPDYGSYKPYNPELKASSLSDFQFVSWALAKFSTVDEVLGAVDGVNIIGLNENIGAVHWRLADRSGRQVVIEIVDGKMNVYDNPVGVLTNSPGFEWHLTNLCNYVNLVPGSAANQSWKSNGGIYEIRPVSGGSGMLGLPGDFTSPSRFVRVAMFKATSPVPANGYAAVMQSFKILEAMVVPIGAVMDVNANAERSTDMITSTQFTSASDLGGLKFYYRTMDNSQIRCIDLNTIDFRKVKYQVHPLDTTREQVQMVAVR